MTISSATRKAGPFLGNGVTNAFPFTFKVFAATDLQVIKTNTVGTDSAPLILNSDYSVSLNADQNANPGGSIAYPLSGALLATGEKLTATGVLSELQNTHITNGGNFFANNIEDQMDYLTILVQQHSEKIARALLASSTDTAPSLSLGTALQRALTYLTFDGSGNASLAQTLPSGTLSQASIVSFLGADPIYRQTPQEIAAAVTPTNTRFLPGHFVRYGAVGDGSTNDTAALTNAAKTGHRMLGGGPEYTYKFTADIPVGSSLYLDGQGCTFKPSGTSRFISTDIASVDSSTISSGGTQGSVSIVVAAATSFAIGHVVRILCTGFPTFWTKLKNVSGTTLTLQNPCPFDYSGVATIGAFSATSLNQDAIFQNCKFDGSLTTGPAGSSGNPFRLGYYRNVRFTNTEFVNFACVAYMPLVQIYNCVQVLIAENQIHDNNLQASTDAIDVQDCNLVQLVANQIDDTGFGVDMIRCTQAMALGNILRGTRTWEISQAVQYSVRGIKITTCGTAQMVSNNADDFSNPFRVDNGFRTIIVGNTSRNSGWGPAYTSDVVINVSATSTATMYGTTIQGNVIENCGGSAIQVNNGTGSAGNGRGIISGNYIRRCNGYGIYCPQTDYTISDNIIEDWNVANIGAYALSYNYGATITGNKFFNSLSSAYICMPPSFQATYKYAFRDNISPTGNPLFSNSWDVQNSGTGSIASGNTSVAVVFTTNLIRAPTADEINFTVTTATTNPPGLMWITAITQSGFTMNCAANPGVSNLPFTYNCVLKMPFTA